MEYIEILKILALSQVITTFAPIGWILELLPNNMIKYILIVLTSCLKCCALWLGLAMFGLWSAIVASIIASIFIEVKQNITSFLWHKKK
jgi:hypothetical protein